jgi:hypothetical protein
MGVDAVAVVASTEGPILPAAGLLGGSLYCLNRRYPGGKSNFGPKRNKRFLYYVTIRHNSAPRTALGKGSRDLFMKGLFSGTAIVDKDPGLEWTFTVVWTLCTEMLSERH